jgi:hypothetical protein
VSVGPKLFSEYDLQQSGIETFLANIEQASTSKICCGFVQPCYWLSSQIVCSFAQSV